MYAVEAVKSMCVLSRKIIEQNGFSELVTVLEGDVSDVQLPGDIVADVLISEWMGFYLLHESMLDSVVTARDRLLRPGAAVFPSTATLYACPVSLKEYCAQNFDFWHDVCGFDFSEAGSVLRKKRLTSPKVMTVPDKSLLAEPQQVLSIDLQYVNASDVSTVVTSLDFVVQKNDVMHGFALWFDVQFDGQHPVSLDTSPSSSPTHWQQTVILLPSALLVSRDSLVQCRMSLQRADSDRRRYDITVEMMDDDETGTDSDTVTDTAQLIKHAMHKVV